MPFLKYLSSQIYKKIVLNYILTLINGVKILHGLEIDINLKEIVSNSIVGN
jgi:hypothetical protein